MSAIEADYRTTKHVPSRKCYQLILEVPEEDFPNVCNVLGYPKTGENTYVAIALLDISKTEVKRNQIGSKTELSEGEKLRTRAVMLCKDREFQIFLESLDKEIVVFNENDAREFLLDYCCITSRSSLAINIIAQNLFKQLLKQYKIWQNERTQIIYSDSSQFP